MKHNKILVIDDEKPTLKMFKLFLDAYGYEIFTADSGEEGLEIFEREKPDIVLTDIKMPGMNGIEVLQAIKKQASSTEVIVITGHGDTDLAIQALNLDATDFINKPIQRKSLEEGLKRAQERLKLTITNQDEIKISQKNDVLVLDIQHSVGSHCELFLRQAYTKAVQDKMAKIIFKFGPNASINGAGISILSQIIRDSEKKKIEIIFVGIAENFYKIFTATGLSRVIKVADCVELDCI